MRFLSGHVASPSRAWQSCLLTSLHFHWVGGFLLSPVLLQVQKPLEKENVLFKPALQAVTAYDSYYAVKLSKFKVFATIDCLKLAVRNQSSLQKGERYFLFSYFH